jgi:hypothetical protein
MCYFIIKIIFALIIIMLLIILNANIKIAILYVEQSYTIQLMLILFYEVYFCLCKTNNTICKIPDSIILSQRTVVSECKPFWASIKTIYYYYYIYLIL